MSTLEAIVESLKTLPPPKLEEAASYIRGLHESTRTEQLELLNRTAGAWSGGAGEAIQKAIEDGCERVDPRDW